MPLIVYELSDFLYIYCSGFSTIMSVHRTTFEDHFVTPFQMLILCRSIFHFETLLAILRFCQFDLKIRPIFMGFRVLDPTN